VIVKTIGSRREAAAGWRAALVALAILGLALTGCGQKQDTASAKDPAQRAQQLIDSGNQAFRAGNYGLAARRYAAAAVERKDDPAAYYGMGMALSKLGRDEEARKAYAKARDLAQSGHK
jgi:Flp pilus assembly protein TadD